MNEHQIEVARSHLFGFGVAVAIALGMALVGADLWAVSFPRHELFASNFATGVMASVTLVADHHGRDIGR